MSLPMSSMQASVPPGFRFHPTDEELVDYYLKKKVECKRIDLDVIREIDLYKIEPWDLQEKCKIGTTEQNEWYFFSHKDKKYPTGTRTNRATTAGFWKATGRDKAIYTKFKLVGMRKTLVFYMGRAPNGQKTDWIMHEYRLENCENGCNQGSEEGWVVCRVFRKRSPNIKKSQDKDSACYYEEQISLLPEFDSPKAANSGDIVYNQPFICKQEFDLDYHLAHDPFIQLPELESPKLTCYASSNIKGLLLDNLTRRSECQAASFCLDTKHLRAPVAQVSPTSLASTTANRPEEQPVTDWRILDRLVASQLSQDDLPSDGRFPLDTTNPLGDSPSFAHASKESNQEYNSNNEVDLWSFGRGDVAEGLYS